MNFFEIVGARYSHKERFLPNPVPLADLEQIAKTGIAAPSGANRQTVQLIILPDREGVLNAISALTPYHSGLATAPAAIAVFTDTTLTASSEPFNFEKEDYSAAVENMLLAATALDYASLWLDHPYFDADTANKASKLMGVPDSFKLWAILPVGKPDGEGSRREKLPYEARVSYCKYVDNSTANG